MQIVIEVSKEYYDLLKGFYDEMCSMDMLLIKHGKPLPKGHGRLIDADALKLTQHDIHVESINYRHRCISVENVDEAPTIIEADKEVDE